MARVPPARRPRVSQALRLGPRAEGRRPRGGGGRARRPPRPERRRQVDAREDRRRARAPDRREAEIAGAPAGSRDARAALGYLAELFRFPGWYTADEVLELHQRLAGSRGGAAERAAARARRARRAARTPRRRDVEGHAAAPRDRAGARRRAADPAPRRADVGARPGRAPHRAPAARGAARPRRLRASQLAPALRDRARLRPRRDPSRRRVCCRGHTGRARAAARCRARDRGRHATDRGRDARGRAAARRRSDPAGRSVYGVRVLRRRSRTPISKRSEGRRTDLVAVIVEYGFREAVRRRCSPSSSC